MHKYRLRQRVHLVGRQGKTMPGSAFEIIRLTPEQNGEPTYRIKSAMEERAVRESEIDIAH